MSHVEAIALCRAWIDVEIHAMRQRRTLASWLAVYDMSADWHIIWQERASNA